MFRHAGFKSKRPLDFLSSLHILDLLSSRSQPLRAFSRPHQHLNEDNFLAPADVFAFSAKPSRRRQSQSSMQLDPLKKKCFLPLCSIFPFVIKTSLRLNFAKSRSNWKESYCRLTMKKGSLFSIFAIFRLSMPSYIRVAAAASDQHVSCWTPQRRGFEPLTWDSALFSKLETWLCFQIDNYPG